MSAEVSTETIPVKIQDLPSLGTLINDDSFIIDRAGEYTGKVRVDALSQHIFDAIGNTFVYYGETGTGAIVGLSSNNTFYIKDNSITLQKLNPDVRDRISRSNTNQTGTTLTGTLSTFTKPLTASGTTLTNLVTAKGQFLIINVGGQYKAVQMWDF
jgi:hypothetical protein